MSTPRMSRRWLLRLSTCVMSGIGLWGCAGDGDAGPTSKYPPLPEAAGGFGAALLDGAIYVYGGRITPSHIGSGFASDDLTNAFRRLELAPGESWEELAPGTPLEGLGLVSHGGYLYRVGGMRINNARGEQDDLRSVATVDRYDPEMARWESMPHMPEGRSAHGTVVVGDMLYVIAGWHLEGTTDSGTMLANGLRLDLSDNAATWEPIPEPPFELRSLSAAALGDKIYAIGGVDGGGRFTSEVHVLDTNAGVWSEGPPLPEAPPIHGFGAAACSVKGKLYVNYAGGLLRLNQAGDGWEAAGVMEPPRAFNGLLCAGEGELVAVGGFALPQDTAPLDDVESIAIE